MLDRPHALRSSRRLLRLGSLLACAALATTLVLAQKEGVTRRGRDQNKATNESSGSFGVGPRLTPEQADFAQKTKPVSEEVLKGFVPATLGGMQRTSLDGSLRYFGAAGTSKAVAAFAGADGRELSMEIVDPCSLPTKGVPYYIEMIPAGQVRETDKTIVEGTIVGGHPAAFKTDKSGRAPRQLQVYLAPRMRVTVSGNGIGDETMIEAVEALELAALAALAPEAPPGAQRLQPKR